MINSTLKKRVVWFIHSEVERVLSNLKNGAVNKDNALGSLSTLFQVASSTKDADSMEYICTVIDHIRSSKHTIGLFYFTEMRQESY
ncbi:hypothetical protein KP806_01075 [Paenibacillus sp. N4]|uniref:hypothetical protein n=1 Tax=Paenibacillus vietnamensis TaxID=2590547 RepID=UPI001CD0D9E8|nr:hypothetical protein [Paenibacillus vietnamensis]MCA0753626.1 hypothetical protein [Paenibacillus vietnamensis]